MEIFVARQPIFDKKQRVFGYELLYRSGASNVYDGTDGSQASLAVIRNTFLILGAQTLTGTKKAFINFTKNLLADGVALTLPNELLVVEIIEDVEPEPVVIDACKKLKEAGYTLALDDFTGADNGQAPLVDLVDIIKADFRLTNMEEQRNIVKSLSGQKKQFLAEKVETTQEFKAALNMGYSYFQGYFFSKPVIVSGKDIPGYKVNYIHVLKEINRRELDFYSLERVIKRDTSLCYTLLNYINSAYFGVREEITSVRHALVLLGEREVRQWASLVLFTFMGHDKPPELIVTSLVRARLCETLAPHVGLRGHESELFLMGMFSTLDAIIGRPLAEILEGINLSQEVKAALLGTKNIYRDLLELVIHYETADWEKVSSYASRLKLKEDKIPDLYVKSVEWAEQIASYR